MAHYQVLGTPYLVSGSGRKWFIRHDGTLDERGKVAHLPHYPTRREAIERANTLPRDLNQPSR